MKLFEFSLQFVHTLAVLCLDYFNAIWRSRHAIEYITRCEQKTNYTSHTIVSILKLHFV